MAGLVTTAQYKTYAGITGSGDDAVIAVLIDTASAAVRRYCRRSTTDGFEYSANRVETLDGNDSPHLQLSEWPVHSIASVVQKFDDGSTATLASSEYRVDSKSGLLYRTGARYGRFVDVLGAPALSASFGYSARFDAGVQNWTVTYAGGFASGTPLQTAIPDDLKFVVYRLIDWMFAERRRNPLMQSESLGQYSYSRLSTGDDSDAAMLRKACAAFRRGVVA